MTQPSEHLQMKTPAGLRREKQLRSIFSVAERLSYVAESLRDSVFFVG